MKHMIESKLEVVLPVITKAGGNFSALCAKLNGFLVIFYCDIVLSEIVCGPRANTHFDASTARHVAVEWAMRSRVQRLCDNILLT